MASGGSAIRGSRVGAGPMGEQDRGFHAERVAVSYWDAMGNETVRGMMGRLARWQERRRTRVQLMTLSERQLKDIGLTRGQAMAEWEKPFWRP